MLIAKNKVVLMDYKLEDGEGALIDSSEGEAFAFIQGSGQIIPGLERSMEGRKKGDKFKVVVPCKEGYGEIDAELVETVDRVHLSEIKDLMVGMQLESRMSDGSARILTVKDIGDKEVVLDANHPLAGIDLTFTIDIIDVRNASAEELSHGHVHGEGGHHH